MRSAKRPASLSSRTLRKSLIWGVFLLVMCTAQTSFFTRLEFLSITPNVVLGAVVAISLLEEQRCALVCSMAAGFLLDAIGSHGISLSPLCFFAVALICTALAKKVMPRPLPYLFLLIPASIVSAMFGVLNVALRTSLPPISTLLAKYILPELLLTVLFSFPLFFVARLVGRLTEKKSKFKM